MKTKTLLSLALLPAIVALAACGSSSSNDTTSSSSTSTPSPATSSSAFSAKDVSGVGTILVDAQGDALYTNDQDTATSVKCTGECASIWIPLQQNGKPVVSNGKPLYTFAQDSPGKVTGDGVTDSFGGVTFMWTVATPSGAASASPPATSTQSDTTGSSGGSSSYGY
jgi:predicted lipoprotein with Yx(FWY)xxD motif